MLLLPALAGLSATANAQSPQAPNPRTTVVVFADRPMPQGQWTALFSALQTGQANGGVETEALGGSAEFTRGDAAEPGLSVETPIVVFLHGNCDLAPLVRRTAFGVPLGWVHQLHGQIEPFAHVDCTHIGQVLGPQALGLNRDQRTSIMAAAIARVILHEWIHIATQCSAHAEQGIEKAQFGVADLMAGDSQPAALLRSTR